MSNLNVDEQVTVFNRTILNILKNFIPRETIVCNDKDSPWFNKRIKSLIQEGTLLHKTFRKSRKLPIIPSLYQKNEFVTDFKKKAELFNFFFTDQHSLISNSSRLPSKLEYLIQSRLSLITFSTDDIAKIIQNLDPNKAHGHVQISIRLLKLYSTSICKPLEITFHQCLETGTFPND